MGILAMAYQKIEAEKLPEPFNITLDGDEHGMTLDSRGDELKIKAINGGQTSMWNTANPDKKVNVGDSIIEVNGKAGTPGELIIFLFALESGRQHNLKIRP